MKNIRLFTILSALVPLLVWAERNLLSINMIDGTVHTMKLDEYPVVTFSDDLLSVKGSSTLFSLNVQKVKDFRYLENSGITKIVTSDIIWNENKVIVNAVYKELIVCVYNLSGQLIISQSIKHGERCEVSFDTLSPGVYIVNVDGSSIKIVRK